MEEREEEEGGVRERERGNGEKKQKEKEREISKVENFFFFKLSIKKIQKRLRRFNPP